eukprot:7391154-Prymnesium_polylepis.1
MELVVCVKRQLLEHLPPARSLNEHRWHVGTRGRLRFDGHTVTPQAARRHSVDLRLEQRCAVLVVDGGHHVRPQLRVGAAIGNVAGDRVVHEDLNVRGWLGGEPVNELVEGLVHLHEAHRILDRLGRAIAQRRPAAASARPVDARRAHELSLQRGRRLAVDAPSVDEVSGRVLAPPLG